MTMPRVLKSVSCLVDVERQARRAVSARRALATAARGAAAEEETGTRARRRAPARKALTELESMVGLLSKSVRRMTSGEAMGRGGCLL